MATATDVNVGRTLEHHDAAKLPPSPLPPFEEFGDEMDFYLSGCPVVRCRRCTAADVSALCDWCDVYLKPDYHFPRRQMHDVCSRDSSTVFAVEVAGEMAGFLVLYRGSRLHNLYLSPDFRRRGIGAALLARFRPETVRAKTNMAAGNPEPFYERNGYTRVAVDPDRPHIVEMARNDLLPAEQSEAQAPAASASVASELNQPTPEPAPPPARNLPSWNWDDAEAARLFREHKAKAALAGKTRRALKKNAANHAAISKQPPQNCD